MNNTPLIVPSLKEKIDAAKQNYDNACDVHLKAKLAYEDVKVTLAKLEEAGIKVDTSGLEAELANLDNEKLRLDNEYVALMKQADAEKIAATQSNSSQINGYAIKEELRQELREEFKADITALSAKMDMIFANLIKMISAKK